LVVRGDSWAAIRWAASIVPPLSKKTVIPVARNEWQLVAADSPACRQRRLIIRNASERDIPSVVKNPRRSTVRKKGVDLSAAIPAVSRLVEIGLDVVVGGHLVSLAPFLVESQPPAFLLCVVAFDLQPYGCRDPCERIDHHADERLVAEADDRAYVDRVEELAGFVGGENRSFAAADGMRRAADRCRRVVRDDLSCDEPIEKSTNGGRGVA